MNKNLTCNQVAALINFYIENKLTPALTKLVDAHIKKCPTCRKKIAELKKILFEYDELNINNDINDKKSETESNKRLLKNLSAYIDNELNSDDNIKVKKITISNPNAREKLETMYKYQKLMQAAYERTKNSAKTDYSKNVINMVNENAGEYSTSYFRNIAILFFILILAVISGFLYLYS